MAFALVLSCLAFAEALRHSGARTRRRGRSSISPGSSSAIRTLAGHARLGWVLDPLTAVMLVMVSLVGC